MRDVMCVRCTRHGMCVRCMLCVHFSEMHEVYNVWEMSVILYAKCMKRLMYENV